MCGPRVCISSLVGEEWSITPPANNRPPLNGDPVFMFFFGFVEVNRHQPIWFIVR